MPGIISRIRLISLFILAINITYAQDDASMSLIKKYAENSFRNGDYEFSLENYLQLYLTDEENLEYNYRIGVCYAETNIDKSAALPYLEFVTSFNDINKKAYYYLGKAYMYNYRFTEAVEAFYEYKVSGINDAVLAEVNRIISMCYYAIEAIQQPINVKFELLDSTINSNGDESFPFVTADETILMYSSNREYVDAFEEYRSNVYTSNRRKDGWGYAAKCDFNTYDNEEIVGMTSGGEYILIHSDGDFAYNDIHIINKKGSKFVKQEMSDLPQGMNTDDIENGATISNDGNTIIFSSNRRGGFGI